jgi:metal-sulfur cluster biosynthetic enzyme
MDTNHLQDALRQIIDPEVGMNIVDLGLIYRLELRDGAIELDLTLTSPSCPMGELIVDEVEQTLNSIAPPSTQIAVNLVWEPPWTAERMSEHARLHFGWKP